MTLVDVADVTLSGWSNEVTADIELSGADAQIDIVLVSTATRFACRARAVDVGKLSAYLRAAEDAPW